MKEHTYLLKMDHIAAGVCYYPEHWGETYWKKDLQLMKELGLETARVGEFAWNFFEPREGVYDFALFDRFLDEAKEAGVKIIFCTPTCTPPAWLSRRYPETLNTTANAVVSFVCAMQVQTFRKVRGHAYASTMCIGNMRSGTEALCAYFHTRDKEILHQALTYFGVVLLFALGAGIGSVATLHWGPGTIWLSCGLLTVSFLIMFIHDEEQKLNE